MEEEQWNQVNPSCLLAYLGIRGFANINTTGAKNISKKGRALIIQKEQMEAYVRDVFNRYDLGKKGLDIEEQKPVKDIVLGMLEIASKSAGMALGTKVGKTGFQ